MKKTVDESYDHKKYLLERSRNVIVVTPKEGDSKPVQRTYDTEHAAICAMSRVVSSPNFSETLYRSIVREVHGAPRRKRNKAPVKLTLEHMLIASLQQRKDEEVTLKEQINDLAKQALKLLKSGKPLTGIGLIRARLGVENNKLRGK